MFLPGQPGPRFSFLRFLHSWKCHHALLFLLVEIGSCELFAAAGLNLRELGGMSHCAWQKVFPYLVLEKSFH
jgi:hypothetical protein